MPFGFGGEEPERGAGDLVDAAQVATEQRVDLGAFIRVEFGTDDTERRARDVRHQEQRAGNPTSTRVEPEHLRHRGIGPGADESERIDLGPDDVALVHQHLDVRWWGDLEDDVPAVIERQRIGRVRTIPRSARCTRRPRRRRRRHRRQWLEPSRRRQASSRCSPRRRKTRRRAREFGDDGRELSMSSPPTTT